MAAEVDGEDPALRTAVAMDRTRATQARTTAGRRHEAQQVQHLLDSDLVAKVPQVDARHGSDGSMENACVGVLREQRRGPGIYDADVGSGFATLPSLSGTGRLRRLARYERPSIFRMTVPSTTRSRIAMANGASPR